MNLRVGRQQRQQPVGIKVEVSVGIPLSKELEPQAANMSAVLAQHMEELAGETETPQGHLKHAELFTNNIQCFGSGFSSGSGSDFFS